VSEDRAPRVAVTRVDDRPTQIVSLQGEHGVESSNLVAHEISLALASGDTVIVDLTALAFAESALLGTLILAQKQAGDRRFAVVAPPETPAARLLNLIHSRAFFLTFPTLDAAIAWSHAEEPHQRKLVKAEKMAEILGMSLSRVYRLAADGTIPSYKVGGAVRFDPVEVLEAVRRR